MEKPNPKYTLKLSEDAITTIKVAFEIKLRNEENLIREGFFPEGDELKLAQELAQEYRNVLDELSKEQKMVKFYAVMDWLRYDLIDLIGWLWRSLRRKLQWNKED